MGMMFFVLTAMEPRVSLEFVHTKNRLKSQSEDLESVAVDLWNKNVCAGIR